MFFAATTDSRSWRGQVIEADRRAAQPAASAPTWVFQFDWPTPIDGGKWGAHHGLDVPFIFDNAAITPDLVGTGAEQLGLARRDERRLDRLRAHRQSQCDGLAGVAGLRSRRAARRWCSIATSRVVDDPRGRERRLFGQVPYVQPGT